MSDSDKSMIDKRFESVEDFEILNVFDDVFEKGNKIVQLLYENYVISNS